MSTKEHIFKIFGAGEEGMQEFDQFQAMRNNPDYLDFADLDDSEDHLEYSVIEKVANRNVESDNIYGGGGYNTINSYRRLVYGDLSNDKVHRLEFYREMASYPDVSEALDEIADACTNPDEDGKIVDIYFTTAADGLNAGQKETIIEAFDDLMSLFNLEEDAFEFYRNFLIDGEICWENIVSDKPHEQHRGIIAVSRIPNECFEYLVDDRYKTCGIVVNGKMIPDRGDETLTTGYDIRQSNGWQSNVGFNRVTLKHTNYEITDTSGENLIPMPMTQITLVNSGVYNRSHTVALPILEKARKPYRQLSLLEDAIIIYRLVRAPERLVFNIPTGRLNMHKAEQVVHKAMQRYQTKKVFDPGKKSIVNDYDPHQMLDAYWFAKPEGSEGTNVQVLQTNASLGKLDDLMYFQKKLYISLKVPYNRNGWAEGNTGEVKNVEEITYDEYRFAKFIMRLQQRFGKGFLATFKTHLKLKGLWDRFNLNDRMFKVKFKQPAAYDIYEETRLVRARLDAYTKATESEHMSHRIAMKKFMLMTDKEVAENYKELEKEKMNMAYIQKKVENIETFNQPYGDMMDAEDLDALDVENTEEGF